MPPKAVKSIRQNIKFYRYFLVGILSLNIINTWATTVPIAQRMAVGKRVVEFVPKGFNRMITSVSYRSNFR